MSEFPCLVATKPLKREFQNVKVIRLSSDEFTLGRSLGNSVVIAFLSLSRKHCIFRRKADDSWTVEDMSAFGLHLNEQRLSKGTEHALSHDDLLQLDPIGEFIYKFINPISNAVKNPPCKKLKVEEYCGILKDAKQLLEESQNFEVESLEMKIKNTQQLQNTKIMMKRQLEAQMEQRIKELNEGFQVQIENLKGEKQEIERQKAELEEERGNKLVDMRTHMDLKIAELKDEILRHTEAENNLMNENKSLRSRLEREREEFLAQLRQAADRDELLAQLQERCRQHDDARLRERQALEESLKKETEQLRIAQEQIEAKAEAERKLREDKESSERRLEILQREVAAKELELKQRADKRVQDEVLKSKLQLTVLQEQLNKVRTELECEKIVRLFSTEAGNNDDEAASLAVAAALTNEGPSVRTQFGDILENELQCTVCADLLIAAVTLNCSHTFCKYCITQWKKKKKECPICRSTITSECRSLVIDSFIDKMVENLSEEMKQKRIQILKERQEVESNTATRTADSRGGGNGSAGATNDDAWSLSDEGGVEEGGWAESEYHEDDEDDDDHDYRYEFYHNYRGRRYYDDDSGSDEESSDDGDDHDDDPYTAAVPAHPGPEANTGGGPGESGAVEPGAGATTTSSGGRGAPRVDTTTRSRSRQVIAGIPGSYYGGYGRCYNCGARGHWAPGCPLNQ